MCAYEASKIPENPDLAEMLRQRGFDRDTVASLILLPLVHTAWADGALDPAEADAIVELASRCGMAPTDSAASLLRDWVTHRPDPDEMEAQLELLSLLLAAVDDELPITVRDVEAMAKAVGKATGGVFGLFFRLNAEEKAALATIREKLGLEYGDAWKKTLAALRDDWNITDWNEFDEPKDLAGLDAADPLLFTDSKALEQYDEGAFRSMEGKPLTRDDLVNDLKIDIMRTADWKKAELQFHKLQTEWARRGLIEDAGVFWNNSPHATVYEAKANLKFRIDGKLHRVKKGEQLVFACQMAQEMMDLDGPFVAGSFSPTAEGMLCGEMSNAMMSMGDMSGGDMGGMGGMGGMGAGDGMSGMDGVKKMQPPPRLDVDRLQVQDTERVAYVVLDLSGSMKGERIRMAKHAVMSFLERIPMNAGVRVVIRTFRGEPGHLLAPLGAPFTMQTRMMLMARARGLEADGPTALFQTVNLALDDVLRMADPKKLRVPKTYLIVLSDGEDNQGLVGQRYRRYFGPDALFARVADYRTKGIIEYLPIAYGGRAAVRNLEQIGGPGFRVEVTRPADIVAKFGEIQKRLMVGMPMGGGMAMGGMSGGMSGGMQM